MIYVGAFPGLWLFMFSCGDMQGHPKQNYLMLYYSTALLQTQGKKNFFFPMGLNFQFIYLLCVPFCTCPRKIHSHVHTPQKQESASSQVPFFSQNLTFIYSVIHPFLPPLITVEMTWTLGNLSDYHRSNQRKKMQIPGSSLKLGPSHSMHPCRVASLQVIEHRSKHASTQLSM